MSRRWLAVLPVCASCALAPAALAADAAVQVKDSFYEASEVSIDPGDKVTWTWVGGLSHSVTSDTGSPEAFDSGERKTPVTPFERTFASAGCFRYHCTVHGAGMSGRVIVGGATCPPPPGPGGGTPPPGDGTQPPPGGGGTQPPPGGGADTAAPRIAATRIASRFICARRTRACRRTSTLVRFELSEAANVTGTVTLLRSARSSAKVVKRLRILGRPGRNSFRLTSRRLKPGRYRLSLAAKDAAGNASAVARVRFSVRR